MLDAAGNAVVIMSDPMRLGFLFLGVIIGLVLGVIPGLGGIVGLAILLPFTFGMDTYAAFALLLGMGSVTTTSDTIPAVLFGVPGTSGSAATILDGHPLAKQGQAGRAFGAAYTASLLGGIFGAFLLAISIPILRPVMLSFGSPEMLGLAIFGLSMVAVLSGSSPLRGLCAAALGLLISFVGTDPQTGNQRWSFDTLYLFEGFPLVPISLGLFALPELADMAIQRRSIASDSHVDSRKGQMQGVRDTFKNWWLVLRVAWLGAALGAVPGLGGPVVDWIAYGYGAKSEKGGSETFGTGDIRGVISSEGANNAKEGGALVPTIAFGVPGSAGMAILLGAFMIHGLQPGPEMLTTHLDLTYSMVWSVALANILGAGICFMFSDQFAKLALIRFSVLMPLILSIVFIAAFQGSRKWGDLYAVFIFGLVGWIMKRLSWPRPPLILGVVLGDIVERYMFVSVDLFGFDWLWRPGVIILFGMALIGIARPFIREVKASSGVGAMLKNMSRPKVNIQTAFYAAYISLFVWLLWLTRDWDPLSKIVPLIVLYSALLFSAISLFNHTFRNDDDDAVGDDGAKIRKELHLDTRADDQGLPTRDMLKRAAAFFGWLLGFMVFVALIGMIPTVTLFVIAYMRVEGREPWRLVAILATGMTVFSYLLFEKLLLLPWPATVLGDLFPILHDTIPSM
ncbi:MAG: tripartite tricarboxylate transporter permease [Rhodospirillales bacterium]|nr:tripartite tricarboxylate transporter permease [Rhodospirillales bacterium]MBT5075380.1 tripartite tricarboxylate transporter permease [Rhodospirillales bacterium]MBT5113132.1 tripartite tricarboxylate transporter permease [Rhodospirillales bacterium]MBT5673008.1 tripartite tricarboxylate transporter permease [Rhodospirillales bacterium]MBT6187685.1 tripartite tricarboxylate transporter permease [Rhodospirillales bacterium]